MLGGNDMMGAAEQAALQAVLHGVNRGLGLLPAGSVWLPFMQECRTVFSAQTGARPEPQHHEASAPDGPGA